MLGKGEVYLAILIVLIGFLTVRTGQAIEDLGKDVRNLKVDIEMVRDQQEELRERMETLKAFEVMHLEVTAYSPMDNLSGMCADGNPEVTATGTKPAIGTVAVNPEIFEYGTEFFIPGYGWGRAEDTGGLIRQREDLIDVVMLSHAEAVQWGRKTLPVLVRG